jgi:hypothetical protein
MEQSKELTNDRCETKQMMKWCNWCKESHYVEFSNTGNDIDGSSFGQDNQNGRVLLHCNRNPSWCAPSGFRVRLLKPAPREQKGRKAPTKIKLKETLKHENCYILCTFFNGLSYPDWRSCIIYTPSPIDSIKPLLKNFQENETGFMIVRYTNIVWSRDITWFSENLQKVFIRYVQTWLHGRTSSGLRNSWSCHTYSWTCYRNSVINHHISVWTGLKITYVIVGSDLSQPTNVVVKRPHTKVLKLY